MGYKTNSNYWEKRSMLKKLLMLTIMILMPITAVWATSAVPKMEAEKLQAMLGSPGVIVLDARAAGAWKDSTEKIQGAIRAASEDYQQWKAQYSKNATIVLLQLTK